MQNTDVVIIGAGPVGLFAVFECGMMDLKCHVIDALDFVGGQCTALYPEKPIYDIPSQVEISGEDLIKNLQKQAEKFLPTYSLGEQVIAITKKNELFTVSTNKNNHITCKAIIIAGGCGSFGPNRPPISNIEEFEKTGKVAYMVKSKSDFINKSVVIAGGGDSAIDWLISLQGIAKKLYLVHRRNNLRGHPESEKKVFELAKNGLIELVIPYQLDSLKGEDGNLKAVLVKDLNNNIRELEADYLLPFYGLSMELGPIANWGLNLHKNHIEVDYSTMQTNIDGIFAIGDICHYKGKKKLILCGFAEGAVAASSIYPLVYPDKEYHFQYSTSKF
jgi:thioredoxin reductase (NADPH)